MTFDVHFGVTNFEAQPIGTPPPVPFVLGGFHITLDPTVASSGSLTFDYFNLPVDSAIGYAFDPSGSTKLVIGGTSSGIAIPNFLQNDVWMEITGLNTPGISFANFAYTNATLSLFYSPANSVIFANASSVATTPLPAALPLFGAALGGLGFMGWRRRKAAA